MESNIKLIGDRDPGKCVVRITREVSGEKLIQEMDLFENDAIILIDMLNKFLDGGLLNGK